MQRPVTWRAVNVALLAYFVVLAPRIATACEAEYNSTFELIQAAIFERHGCTSAYCHDATASGGLNLLRGAAYDSLVFEKRNAATADCDWRKPSISRRANGPRM